MLIENNKAVKLFQPKYTLDVESLSEFVSPKSVS